MQRLALMVLLIGSVASVPTSARRPIQSRTDGVLAPVTLA